MKIIRIFLNLLFPPRCILCRKILKEEETDLCHACWTDAPEFPVCRRKMHPSGKTKLHFLDSFTAVWYYEGYVRRSILRYKFHRARNYAHGYGRFLAMKLTVTHPEGFDLLTWVPVSSRRKRKRGYDQAELLANAVGQELELTPVKLLNKIRNNPPQSRMSAEQRKANVLGVYERCGTDSVAGKRVLLVDDIFTTGSTAEECARVLLTAGAKEVHCAAVATAQEHQ